MSPGAVGRQSRRAKRAKATPDKETTAKPRAAKPRIAKAGARAGAYQLKVSLRHARPPIWRRLMVPASITLADLHRVLQHAMGWDEYHLHAFDVGGRRYGTPDPELDLSDERRARLCEVAPTTGDRFTYEYDFGDSWMHDIAVEKIVETSLSPCWCLGEERVRPRTAAGSLGMRT